jgi:predicted secreted protein
MTTVEVSDAGFGQTIELAVGDELVLRLSENPTTGFRWEVPQSGDSELLPRGDPRL